MGRAGSIHLANIIANPRVELAYVVESDSSIWEGCRTKWNLSDDATAFVHPDDVSKVYEDSEVDASIICTPTFTHEEYIMGSLKSVRGKTENYSFVRDREDREIHDLSSLL